MIRACLLPLAAIAALSAVAYSQTKTPPGTPRVVKPEDLKALSWRSIGPANMGGRVADICLAPGNGKTFFVAFGVSGLWKTVNLGTTLNPVFDHEVTNSIGSVMVADAPSTWKGWKEDKENAS